LALNITSFGLGIVTILFVERKQGNPYMDLGILSLFSGNCEDNGTDIRNWNLINTVRGIQATGGIDYVYIITLG
jgi:hypothetical protein